MVKCPLKASAGTTIRRTRWLPRELGPKGAPKIQLCGSESDERTPKKEMNMMKVNETHDHAVYEKIKVLHYSISGCRRVSCYRRVNYFSC